MPYLKFAVESVLGNERDDLELVVSVNHSSDSSLEYLESVGDPRLRVVRPNSPLTMSEHWDFAQSHAMGDWQMFLGADDLLMKNYAESLDDLILKAQSENVPVIVARRAYVTWRNGLAKGLMPLQYWRTDETRVIASSDFLKHALLTEISYHSGPQMYTSSIVSKSVTEEIRSSNQGHLITGHPQDAYLCASLAGYVDRYLWSGTPFSYVGTSEKSAGLSVTHSHASSQMLAAAKAYKEDVEETGFFPYRSNLSFSHGVDARYLFDALRDLRPDLFEKKPFASKLFLDRMEIHFLSQVSSSRLRELGGRNFLVTNRFFVFKAFLASILRSFRKLRVEIRGIISVSTSGLLRRHIGFRQVVESSDDEELFGLAMNINSMWTS